MTISKAFEYLMGTAFTAAMIALIWLGATRNSMPFVLFITSIAAIHLIVFRLIFRDMLHEASKIEKNHSNA